MKRFHILPCVDEKSLRGEGSLESFFIPLRSEVNANFMMLFPISKEVASLYESLISFDDDISPDDSHKIQLLRTMIDSWKEGGRFLSGISFDLTHDYETNEAGMSVKGIISSIDDGYVDTISPIDIFDAIALALMEDLDILVSEDLLEMFFPDDESLEDIDDDDEDYRFIRDTLSGPTKE